MLKKVAIRDLRPNPFRRLEEYPIHREKVEVLKRSFASTGFWGTIVGRPAEGPTVEIAFGHHRLVALRESMGPDESVEIIVRKKSNEDMLRMMAAENMEEWGTSAWVELETVRATIVAYGKGLIELPAVPSDTNKQHILYACLAPDKRPYTKTTVAVFLGWIKENGSGGVRPNAACEAAFMGLDAIDEGLINEVDIVALARKEEIKLVSNIIGIRNAERRAAKWNADQAQTAREQARAATSAMERRRHEERERIHREQARQHQIDAETKARDFGKKTADKVRSGEIGVQGIEEEAAQLKPAVERPMTVKQLDDLAQRVARKLEHILNGDDDLSGDVAFLRKNMGDLTPLGANMLVQSAAALKERIEGRIVNAFWACTSNR